VYRYRTWVGVDALREREREREREELGGLGGFWQLLCEENFKMLKSLMIKKNKSI
jgi:hypothetical protein